KLPRIVFNRLPLPPPTSTMVIKPEKSYAATTAGGSASWTLTIKSLNMDATERLPAEPAALAPTSNRKAPQEGHYIRTMDSRAKRRKSQKQQDKTMKDSEQWQQQHRAFGALDWASE